MHRSAGSISYTTRISQFIFYVLYCTARLPEMIPIMYPSSREKYQLLCLAYECNFVLSDCNRESVSQHRSLTSVHVLRDICPFKENSNRCAHKNGHKWGIAHISHRCGGICGRLGLAESNQTVGRRNKTIRPPVPPSKSTVSSHSLSQT